MRTQVRHITHTMGTRGLPDIYTLSPWACGPRALGVCIRQIPHAHDIIIICIPFHQAYHLVIL